MTDTKVTPSLLDVLTWAAGRPGHIRARALDAHAAMEAGLLAGRPGGFDLTDAGRQLLDEHSPNVAGWVRPAIKVLTRSHTDRASARVRHHFAGRAGDQVDSTCGGWRLPTGYTWPLKHYSGLEAGPAGSDCKACQRLLARKAAGL